MFWRPSCLDEQLDPKSDEPDAQTEATVRFRLPYLITFGRKFLANPDLTERFRGRVPLNADDRSTYYGGRAKGYTDYPTLAQERGEEPKPCVNDRWR